ncbi:gamma-type small acid-soluble spore protein [Sporosarcina highlanderae]|uniref:Small, acid-soluble spore protein gamma-type n=1 Tax=Sporosarcina highlanderae TaxID=3035916 RepID=A0ABT8JTA4_9BACL|nr:gamma-type small acid-soluble spore protein [Sporosarcina highlanderae]MDN4608388.1 gamma-type small acid-soluble spore protein [Sporosarcina highlanderae]
MPNKNQQNFGKQAPQASFTNANKVKQQIMSEEFGSETDVNEVRKQNQQSEMNKTNTSGGAFGSENQSK